MAHNDVDVDELTQFMARYNNEDRHQQMLFAPPTSAGASTTASPSSYHVPVQQQQYSSYSAAAPGRRRSSGMTSRSGTMPSSAGSHATGMSYTSSQPTTVSSPSDGSTVPYSYSYSMSPSTAFTSYPPSQRPDFHQLGAQPGPGMAAALSSPLAPTLEEAGWLPCELRILGLCDFASDDVDSWVEHVAGEHLGYVFPDVLICWFCDECIFDRHSADAGGDGRWSLWQRAEHIRDHLVSEPLNAERDVRPDFFMLDHLRLHGIIDEDTYREIRRGAAGWDGRNVPRVGGLYPAGFVPEERRQEAERRTSVVVDLEKQDRRRRREATAGAATSNNSRNNRNSRRRR
ncbi:hypothetical protein GGR56DRAFT_369678 [Xylariaceae sp. FL0804]|nr:hypothetical protein GGR56DRAFT_369678 [Xylariaceae sp. FL0804]